MQVVSVVGPHLFLQPQLPVQKNAGDVFAGAINPNGMPHTLEVAPALGTTLHLRFLCGPVIQEMEQGPFPWVSGGTADHLNESAAVPMQNAARGAASV